MECCDHLSKFVIDGVNYASNPNPHIRDRSMKVKLGDVLKEGEAIAYDYDFGTTTTLDLGNICQSYVSTEGKEPHYDTG